MNKFAIVISLLIASLLVVSSQAYQGVIPEPSSMLLLGMGLMGAGVLKRRKK